MTFENFTNIIKEEIEKRLKENESCKVKKILKNNGLEMTGIYFVQEDINISPTVYLDQFYEEYRENKISIGEVADQIYDIYDEHKFNRGVDLRDFFEFSKIRDRVVFKLINKERNEEYLRDVPYFSYYDLAVIFQVLVSEEKIGSATITVKNTHLDIWNIEKEELFKLARENTPELRKAEFKTMKSVLAELSKDRDEDLTGMFDMMQEITPMYVLSNRAGICGATCILYPGMLKGFAEAINGDFYIIPCSIHEVILVPAIDGQDCLGLQSIIREVNENEIPEEEVLSDSLYIYKKDIDSFEIVESEKESYAN